MKKPLKTLCLILSLTILIGSFLVQAESNATEYESLLQENVENAISDIFNNEANDIDVGSMDNGTVMPLWGGGSHESTVTTSYGTQLTAFLKTMCTVPDDGSVNFTYSLSKSNYLGLTSTSILTLSNGSTFTPSDSFTFGYKKIFHGRGNYVASIRFLYTVAKNLVNNTYS